MVFSWDLEFGCINFKAHETKDCSGIEVVDNFQKFINSYINTDILTLLYVPDIYVINTDNGYFDYDYIDYDWIE